MPCHLRRRPTKRSPATPVCPTGCAPEHEPRLSPVQTSTSDYIQFDLWAQQLSCYFGIDHLGDTSIGLSVRRLARDESAVSPLPWGRTPAVRFEVLLGLLCLSSSPLRC